MKMKRLTERSLDYCTQLCSDEDAISCAFYKGEQEEKCWRANMYDRLAAYEDTGLEPEEVEHTKNALAGKSLAEIKEINGLSVQRMIELAKAEQEGRLVVLPCNVGDAVWFNTYKNNATECVGIQPHEIRRVNIYFVTDGADIPQWDIGKTVFLTRAEAENAMEVSENEPI